MKKARIVTNVARFEGDKFIRGHTEEYIIKGYANERHLLSLVNDIIKNSVNYNSNEVLKSLSIKSLPYEDARYVEEHFTRKPIYASSKEKKSEPISVMAEIYGPV